MNGNALANELKNAFKIISYPDATIDEIYYALDYFEDWLPFESSMVLEKLAEAGVAKYKSADEFRNELENVLFDFLMKSKATPCFFIALSLLVELDHKNGTFLQPLLKSCRLHQFNDFIRDCYFTAHANFKISYDINYVENGDEKQKFDLFEPVDSIGKLAPTIIYFHGGAWQYGDRLHSIKRLRHFMGMGVKIIAVGYRLAERYQWPCQLDDAESILEYVRKNYKELGIDKEKLAVWGSSAGGQIGANLVARNPKDFKVFINYCAPLSFEEHIASLENDELEHSPIYKLLGDKSKAIDATVYNHLNNEFPAALTFHGIEDTTVPLRESEKWHQELSQLGVKSDLVPVEGQSHRLNDLITKDKIIEFCSTYLV